MNDDAGSVFYVSRGDGARWGSGSQAERLRECRSYAAPARKQQIRQEERTTLGLNSALPGRLWMKIRAARCDGPAQRKAQRFAHVAAREQDLGAAFTTDTRAAATPSHQGDTVPLLNPTF